MTTMQQCRVRGVRSVELAVTNLEEAGRFYESVWGLRPVDARAGVRLYRGTAAYHHIVGLHQGTRPGLVRIVLDVADRDGVDALHHAISAAGGPVTTPARLVADGGGYGFGCRDPDGRNLAFVAGGDWKSNMNPNSLVRLAGCRVKPSLATAKAGERYQFERQGYFVRDPDATAERPVFNRTVGLRDTFAKEVGGRPA